MPNHKLYAYWQSAVVGDFHDAVDYLDKNPNFEISSPGIDRAMAGAIRFLSGNTHAASHLLTADWSATNRESAGLAGAILLGLGNFSQAHDALLYAVSGPVQDAGSHLTNLGRALVYSGRHSEALSYLNQAKDLLEGQPGSILVLQSLAEAHLCAGQLEKALEQIPESDNESLIAARVHLLAASARYQDALDYLRRSRETLSGSQSLLLLHSQLCVVMGRKQQAYLMLKKALENDNENITLWARLAQLGRDSGLIGRARDAANTALALSKTAAPIFRATALTAHAGVLSQEGDLSQAELIYREANQLIPNFPPALSGLGQLLMQAGRVNEALELFNRVRAIQPLQGWLHLIHAREIPDDPTVLEAMERMARVPSLEGPVATHLLFALASAWDSQKNYTRAMDFAREANEASKKLLPYSPDFHRARVDRIIARFSKNFIDSRSGWGHSSQLPVFVLGMPRSGTTLTEQILASHSQVFGAGELGLVQDQIFRLELWERHLGSRQVYPECITNLGKLRSHQIASDWLKSLQAFDSKASHVVDKLPHNFENVGVIKLLFPNAIIFHCRREARDIAVSNYITDYGAKFGGMGFAYDLGWIGEQLVDHDRLMRHWHELFPGQIFEVVYEDLVDDVESWARRMIDFMGLDWEPGVLEFQDLERPVKTASVWQVRQPVYKTSKERWRCYEPHLKPLEEALAQVPEAPAALPLPSVEPELFSLAMSHMKGKRYTQAIEDFSRLLGSNPQHAAAHHFMGGAYFEIHDLPRAIACMRQSVKLHPFHPTWWENLAKAEAAMGEEALAQRALQRAQQLRQAQLPAKSDPISDIMSS